MNRDALLATIIGFGIGLVITGILLVGPTVYTYLPALKFTLPNLPHIGFARSENPTPAAPVATEETPLFTIDSPHEDAIEPKNTVLVSGKAFPQSLVVVQGELNEDVVVSTPEGTYAATVTLQEGRNDILVIQLTQPAEEKSITIYYTEEEF